MEPYAKVCPTLRKDCETDWLQTFDVFTVCQWLGHSPAVAQRHYHGAKDEDFQRASGKVSGKVSGKNPITEIHNTCSG